MTGFLDFIALTHHTLQELTNEFGQFFLAKVENIRYKLDNKTDVDFGKTQKVESEIIYLPLQLFVRRKYSKL